MTELKAHGTVKVFEGFAGYGGATFGLARTGISFEVTGYSEIDKFSSVLYNLNHLDKNGRNIMNFGDISLIHPQELPDFDFFTGGFPCQPFSSVGLQEGEADRHGRGTLLHDILRICAVKKPKYILLENVKGLLSKKFADTFGTVKSKLNELGYGEVKYALLNTKNYGIPQNRERVWIFARLGGLPDDFSMIPPIIENNLRLPDFLDLNPEEKLYLSQKQIARIQEHYKISSLNVNEPSCFDLYNRKIRTDGFCITILSPEHNKLRIVEPQNENGVIRLRKMSVSEQFRLMGFRDGEINFGNQSYTQLSKRAANGWDINLVGILLNHIWQQLL
ncbi:MAG: DNA (cytosine-5-)-methyltransferase [Eubacteriales bacterium]